MSRKWVPTGFAAGALILLTGLAAQAADDALPMWHLFEQPDAAGPYDGQYDAPTGYFFNIHGLYWWISRPDTTTIGREGLAREVYYAPEVIDPLTGETEYAATTAIQTNSLDTGFIATEGSTGTRWEFGNMGEEHGWLVSIFDMHVSKQEAFFGSSDMTFEDVTTGGNYGYLYGNVEHYLGDGTYSATNFIGPLPVTFDNVYAFNRVDTWGAEAMYVRRFGPVSRGGSFEMFLGARYLEFNDRFYVEANGDEPSEGDDDEYSDPRFEYDEEGNIIAPGNVLADSNWLTDARNRIIGPQIGLRWWKRFGRIDLTSEARFFAGFNFQSLEQSGTFGSQLDEPMPYDFEPPVPYYPYTLLVRRPVTYHNTEHFNEFSPGVELRLSADFHLTEAITLTAGWTGLWIDGIARSSDMIYYSVPDMGILADNNRQDVFMNGVHVGLQINR